MSKLTIKNLDVYPMNNNFPTSTELWFDPRDRTVGISQEMKTNSQTMDSYNGLELSWKINGYINPDGAKKLIKDLEEQLIQIADGFEETWDGRNIVGQYNKPASEARYSIERLLSDNLYNDYEAWDVEDYLYDFANDEIGAETTDEQIVAMSAICEKTAEQDDIHIIGDVKEYFTQFRDGRIEAEG